ncbi:uroporphyrinogen-III C-methyltransferase [Rhizobiaceae bacterium BDR2-2]|uniref:uroporphyrinogen-III C-methyltransferase n=1 Tax=Ectorhizobium quercum TaxID=2965071 RepID=A0AAE3SVV1_9HYPH|nr:uroporphyrinogen-III C-methyltransferase [Ectorhizobium quercum]MCX8998063.1 uroporphyrinogen-III C-methyltransferase [Ectorhizobium quercum]
MTLTRTLSRFEAGWPDFRPGHVWLAGAGPGDPRHLTLEVASALSRADAVVYDALVNEAVLSLAPQADLLYAGKRGGRPSAVQEDICKTLIDLARDNGRVLRLKGGDPFLFGRGGEEALALRAANIPFRVLPGLTSAFAALATAHIPATMRGMSRAVTFATGHAADEPDDLDWAALARTGEPIIVYMGMKNLDRIVAKLKAAGLSGATPAAVIMAATTPGERILTATLDTLAEEAKAQGFAAPALIVIGEIVAVRAMLAGETAA